MSVKVLHAFRTYFPDTQGGGQEVIRQICFNTRALGVESRVYFPSFDPNPSIVQNPEAEVHRVKMTVEIASCGISLTGFRRFKQLADWADVIHYHFPWPFADVLHFATRVNKPTLLTYHSDIVRQSGLLKLYRPLMNRFLDSVDRIVCTSPNYLELSEELQKRQDKTTAIPIGVDESTYPVARALQEQGIREKYGNDFFLFVGVLRYYKALDVLLDALKQCPEIKVVIVGMGPLEEELKAQASSLGLQNVTFAGFVDDVTKMALLKVCKGIVFPSHLKSEAFGVTLLEGMMMNKPLITTDNGSGTALVNVDGETGLVVPAENPAVLGQALQKLAVDETLCQKLGQGARERFDAKFTGERMGEAYYDEYCALLETRISGQKNQPLPCIK